MRKGFITASILAGGLLFSTVACNNSTPAKKHTYTIEITNKEELQAEWLSDDLGRSVDLTITKDGVEQNATREINAGNLTFSVDNPDVVRISGRTVSPKAAGTAVVTAKYGDKTDSFTATITQADTHGKSEDDPFTVAEAVAKCVETGTTETSIDYFTKGVVVSIGDPYSEQHKNITFNIADSETGTKQVKCYRVIADDKSEDVDLTKIGVGSEVLLGGHLVNYNGNTPEYVAGTKVYEMTEGYQPKTIVATVAEALAAAKALAENSTSKDKYEITGYITAVDASGAKGFYMSDVKGAVEPSKDQFLVYYGTGTIPADATVNAKVKILDFIKYYKSTSSSNYAYETAGAKGPEAYTLLEPGDTPEPPAEGDFMAIVESPVVGTKYKLGMKFSGRGDASDRFLTGEKDGNFGATSISYADGVEAELVAAATEGKYNVKLTYSNGSVKYMNGVASSKYTNVSFDDEAKTEYEYNADAKTLFFECTGHDPADKDGTYFFGTYGATNVTVNASFISYITGDKAKDIDVSQFPIHFCTKGEAPAPKELTGISISPESKTVNVYEGAGSATFTVSPEPAEAELGEVVWSFVDTGHSLTLENGVVSVPQDAVEEGGQLTVRIMATCGEFNNVASVVVIREQGGEDTGLALSEAGADFTGCTSADKAMPAGCTWTYITNNPQYPDPSFNNGGFKFSFINQGLLSAELLKSDEITVTIKVGALNGKSSTTKPTDPTFTVYGLGADESVLDTETSGVVSATGDVVLKLEASSMKYVKIMFTGFGWNGTKQSNVRVDTITLA